MRVAFLGLGIMGSRMAANVRAAGHELVVWNRTRERADAFGGEVAATPAVAAATADVVVTMLVDGPQVERVVLDGPDAAAAGARPGALLLDMSTIGPQAARAIAAAAAERGLPFVDAPVTGSAPKAEAGTLTIMAGGEPGDVERARPLFDAMGELVVHVGPVGHGQMAKVINNSVAAANAVTLGQALLVGKATGVDLDALEAVMRSGSGGSAMLELKAGAMRDHDFAPLFKLEHMLKDVRLCLEATESAGAPFPAAAEAREVLATAMGRGLGEADFAALVEVLEDVARLTLPS